MVLSPCEKFDPLPARGLAAISFLTLTLVYISTISVYAPLTHGKSVLCFKIFAQTQYDRNAIAVHLFFSTPHPKMKLIRSTHTQLLLQLWDVTFQLNLRSVCTQQRPTSYLVHIRIIRKLFSCMKTGSVASKLPLCSRLLYRMVNPCSPLISRAAVEVRVSSVLPACWRTWTLRPSLNALFCIIKFALSYCGDTPWALLHQLCTLANFNTIWLSKPSSSLLRLLLFRSSPRRWSQTWPSPRYSAQGSSHHRHARCTVDALRARSV